MYNGIGLQTARGSGTNGYVQTNKFFVKPKAPRGPPATDSSGGGGGGEGIRKPNKEILDHDRKRQIEIKLLVLSETLADQGYTETEIAERVEEKRRELDAAAAAAAEDPEDGEIVAAPFASRPSETQSHQVAARKEKQMETLKAAFGLLDKPRGRRQGDEHPEKNGEKASGSKDLINQHEKVRYTTTKAEVERNEMEHDKKNDGRDRFKERKKYERNYESSDSGSSGDKTRRDKKHEKAQHEKVKYNTTKAKEDRNEMEHDKKNDGRSEIKERKKYDRNYESSDGGSSGDKMRRDKRHEKAQYEKVKYNITKAEVDRNPMEHGKRNKGSEKTMERMKYDRNYESSDSGGSDKVRRERKRHRKTHDTHSDSEAATTSVHKKGKEGASRRDKKEKRKRYNNSSDSESDRVNFKREPVKYAKRSKRHDSDSDY